MGKLKNVWTLKIRLGRHGFEFDHRPLNRVSRILNIAMVISILPVMFSLWALPICIAFTLAALIYKEPDK